MSRAIRLRLKSLSRTTVSDTLRVTGVIGADAGAQNLRLPMTDPVRFAAEALGEALRARGIEVGGAVRVVHDAEAAAALSGYLRTEDGRELIFSIFSNASALPAAPVVSAIDRMVEALAR